MDSAWIAVVLAAITVIQGIPAFIREARELIRGREDSANITQPRSRARRAIITMCILVMLAWGAVLFGVFYQAPQIIFADAVINSWDYRNGAFVVEVRGAPLLQFKRDYNLVLYVKPPIPGANRMEDTHGEKSKPYTIYDGIITLMVPVNKELCESYRAAHGGGTELIVVLLPKKFEAVQITSLSSLETMGGKIVAHPGWPNNYPPECASLK